MLTITVLSITPLVDSDASEPNVEIRVRVDSATPYETIVRTGAETLLAVAREDGRTAWTNDDAMPLLETIPFAEALS